MERERQIPVDFGDCQSQDIWYIGVFSSAYMGISHHLFTIWSLSALPKMNDILPSPFSKSINRQKDLKIYPPGHGHSLVTYYLNPHLESYILLAKKGTKMKEKEMSNRRESPWGEWSLEGQDPASVIFRISNLYGMNLTNQNVLQPLSYCRISSWFSQPFH